MDKYIRPNLKKAAIITIDTQNDFSLPGAVAAYDVLPNIAKILNTCRENNVPIIHVIRIYKEDASNVDREKCIKESLRVLKKGGILAIAYINKHFVLNSIMTRDKKFLTYNFIEKVLNKGVIKEGEKECFWTDTFFTTPMEMESFVKKFNTEIIDHVGTDGLSPLLKDFVDNMNDEKYSTWLHYSLNSCREKSILGMSNHGLLLCKK